MHSSSPLPWHTVCIPEKTTCGSINSATGDLVAFCKNYKDAEYIMERLSLVDELEKKIEKLEDEIEKLKG